MSFLDEINDAFKADNFELFKKHVDTLKSIDAPDEEWSDQTAFLMISASMRSDASKFKYGEYLLDKGAKINQTCGSMAPLLDAAQNGAIEWMKVLIARGADVNYFEDNYPAILKAIAGDVVESVEFLLSQPSFDVELTQKSAYGDTLMTFAKNKKAKKCIALFKQLKVK